MILSILVAVAENNVIGKDNTLIWHLPADLQLFKRLTMGHSIVMGRKTFESIGKPLPGRKSIIITHQQNYAAPGCTVVHSLEEALLLVAAEEEAFIIGGSQIFEQAMDLANRIYYTKIEHSFEGDAFFPILDENKWKLASIENFSPDEKNNYCYSFSVFEKKQI